MIVKGVKIKGLIITFALVAISCGKASQRPGQKSNLVLNEDNTTQGQFTSEKSQLKKLPQYTGGTQRSTQKKYTSASPDAKTLAIVKGRVDVTNPKNLRLSTKVFNFKVKFKDNIAKVFISLDSAQRDILEFEAHMRSPLSKKYQLEATGVPAKNNPNYDINIACEDQQCKTAVIYLNQIKGSGKTRQVVSRAGMIYRVRPIQATLKLPNSEREELLKISGVKDLEKAAQGYKDLVAITKEVAFGRSKYSVHLPMPGTEKKNKLCVHFDLVDTQEADEEVRFSCQSSAIQFTGGRIIGNSTKGDILLELDLDADHQVYFQILSNDEATLEAPIPEKVKVEIAPPAAVAIPPKGEEPATFFAEEDKAKVEEEPEPVSEKSEDELAYERAIEEALAEAARAEADLNMTLESIQATEAELEAERVAQEKRDKEITDHEDKKKALEQEVKDIQSMLAQQEAARKAAEAEAARQQAELKEVEEKAKKAKDAEKKRLEEEAQVKRAEAERKQKERDANMAELKKQEDEARQKAEAKAAELKREQDRLKELNEQKKRAREAAEAEALRLQAERERVEALKKEKEELQEKAEAQKQQPPPSAVPVPVTPSAETTFFGVNLNHALTKNMLAEASYPLVQQWIAKKKTGGMKRDLQLDINSLARKWSQLAHLFRDANAPTELMSIAFAESSYFRSGVDKISIGKKTKYIKEGHQALGPWQFLLNTGKSYGLKVFPVTPAWYNPADERADIVKATRAGIHYLMTSAKKFNGDMLLTYASYLTGPGAFDGKLRCIQNPKAKNCGQIATALGQKRLALAHDLGLNFRTIAAINMISTSVRDYAGKNVATSIIMTNLKAYGFTVPQVK